MKIFLALDGTKDVTPRVRAEMAGRVGVACLVCVLPEGKDPDDLTAAEWDAVEGDARPALDEWIAAIEGESDAGERKRLRERLGEQAGAWIGEDPSGAGEIRARLASGLGLTAGDMVAWLGEVRTDAALERGTPHPGADTAGSRPSPARGEGDGDGPMFPNQPAPLGKALVGDESRGEISNFITEYRNAPDKDLLEEADAGDRDELKELRELDKERLKIKRLQAEHMRRKEAKEPTGEYPADFETAKQARLEGLATAWKCTEKATMVAKNIDQIRGETRKALAGWPMKLISGSLFVDDERDLPDREFVAQEEGKLKDVILGPPVLMIEKDEQFLSLLHDYGRVKFSRGQDVDKANFVGTTTLFSNICSSPQTRVWLEVERFPHAPAMEAHYYAYRGTRDDYQPDGRYLVELLGFFDQVSEPYHRALFAASVLSVFWGGPYGKRPFFYFFARLQDSGKTTAAEMITLLVGGFASLNFGQRDEERLKERILSDEFAGTRCLLADNILCRVDSPLLAELATASWISGKKLRVGEAKKPNSLCVFLTGNNPQLNSDISTRTFFVKFDPIQSVGEAGKDITERSSWATRLRDFLRVHNSHVMADCLMILSQDVPAADFSGVTKERNAEWVEGVLVKVMANPRVRAAIGDPKLTPKDVLLRNQAFRDSVNEEVDEATRFLQALVERCCEWHGFRLASEGGGSLAHVWPRDPVFIRASPPEKKKNEDEDDESRQNIATVWKSVIRGDVNPTWVGRRVNTHIEAGRLKGLTPKRTGVRRGYVLDPELIVQFIAERAYMAKHGAKDDEVSIVQMRANVFHVVEEWRQGQLENATPDTTTSEESVTL